MNIRPVGAELFQTDRHDVAKGHILPFCKQA